MCIHLLTLGANNLTCVAAMVLETFATLRSWGPMLAILRVFWSWHLAR